MITTPEGWTLTIVPDAAALGQAAADRVAQVVRQKPDAVLSLPTGSTPLGMFDILVDRIARGELDPSRVELFLLDEYVGVAPEDPNSLTGWLRRVLLDRAAIPITRVHPLPATASDLDTAAAAFERDLTACGGLDLAVLGLGPNGHIAYNEPGSGADSRTRALTLTPESIAQASAYWHDTVPIPRRAMTMGVGTLLDAKRIVLIVSGQGKASVLRRALEEPSSAETPASWLRLAGPRLEIIADRAAASELDLEPPGQSRGSDAEEAP
jgi:glucosamine-6-phosphate deaminase